MVLIAAAFLSACSGEKPQELLTVEFSSPAVARTLKYTVALPRGYDSGVTRYPVLYLLHGLAGNHTQWVQSAFESSRSLGLIIVMPDAGNSWYINWSRSEGGQSNDWEDFIIRDLMAHVDMRFRTIPRREGRAICGLSMGGYGALTLGLRHPEKFCSLGSFSGALNYARGSRRRVANQQKAWVMWEDRISDKINPRIGIPGFSSQKQRTPLGDIFVTPEECDAYDPFTLVLQVPRPQLPHIYLACGTEDRLLDVSLQFLDLLNEHKIPVTFAQSPGEHNWAYWNRELGHALAVQFHILQMNLERVGSESPAVKE